MGSRGGPRGVALIGMAVLVTTVVATGASAQDASPATAGFLGTTREVFRDDMAADGTWQLIEDETGVTAYDPDHRELRMSVIADNASVWDDAELEEAVPVLRMESWVATSGEGTAGVACGSALGVPRWLWAGVDGDAGWLFGRMIDGRLQVVERGDLPIEVDGRHVTLAIECASDPAAGGDHAVVTADGIVLTSTFDIPVGPYDRGTLIVAADAAPVEARFDDVVIGAGDAYVPPAPGVLPSPAG